MSELFSETEFTSRLGYKLLIAGLAEAGKTATKRIFFLQQQLRKVTKLPATVNYERIAITINDVPITILDLGGQEIFLKRFLNEMSPFIFSNVVGLIYLIDVNNKSTRNSSIEYFTGCIKNLSKYSPEAKYFVLLHKNDLVEKWPNYESIHEQLKEQFQLASPKKVNFFRTTIYRPETIVNGLGRLIEITIPELARSEFVGGKEIGEIEEVTQRFVTHQKIRDVKEKDQTHQIPKEELVTQPSPKIDDPISNVEKLKALMKGSILEIENAGIQSSVSASTVEQRVDRNLESEQTDNETPLTEEPAEIEKLKTLINAGKAEKIDSSIFESKRIGIDDHTSPPIEPQIVNSEAQIDQLNTSSKEEPIPDEQIIDIRAKNLAKYSGIGLNDAKEIVKSNYDDSFGLAITSGIPINTARDIFLNFIPLIKIQPGLDIKVLNKDRLLNIFMAFAKNLFGEDQFFDILLLYCERPNLDINEIVQFVHQQNDSKYELLLSNIKHRIPNQSAVFHDKFLTGIASNTQERVNKLLLLNSDLQIEEALSIVKNNFDDLFFLATQMNISFNFLLDVILHKLPMLYDIGINIKVLNNQQIATLLQNYSMLNYKEQGLLNYLIEEYIYYSREEEDISHSFPENHQDKIKHLLQITNNLEIEDVSVLVDLDFGKIITFAKSLNMQLVIVLKILFKYIPEIKAEGFNIRNLTQQRILTVLSAYGSGLIKEERLKDCLTLLVIKSDTQVLEIIQNFLVKSEVLSIKTQEIERVEKEAYHLKGLEGLGFKLEKQEKNFLLTLFQFGKPIGNAMISSSISFYEIKYLLTYELNLPSDFNYQYLETSAKIIHDKIQSIS